MPFISFFFGLVVLGRTSNTLLNKNSESEHPCFVPDLRGSVSSLDMMIPMCFSYVTMIMLR